MLYIRNDIPRISVVIPVYNGAIFLREAVESVIAQEYGNTEILIVDDGSTDNTPDEVITIIEEYRLSISIKYFRQENQGPSVARNTGILHASGDFIAFLDADDLFAPDKFKIQMGAFVKDADLDLVAGRIQYVSLEGAETREVKYDPDDQAVVHVHLGSMLVRKRVFEKIGLFDSGLRYSEDVEWWLRIREKPLHFVILHDITLHYRLHGGNMTRGLSGIGRPFLEALKKSLVRRRSTGNMHLKQMTESLKRDDKKEDE